MLLHLFSEETFEELISKLAAKVDVSGLKNVINVNRDDVLDGAFRGFRRPTFDSKKLLNVRFCGEDGIDNGGVTREFLRIAVSAVKTSSIFTGPDDARNIVLDYNGTCCSHAVHCSYLSVLFYCVRKIVQARLSLPSSLHPFLCILSLLSRQTAFGAF